MANHDNMTDAAVTDQDVPLLRQPRGERGLARVRELMTHAAENIVHGVAAMMDRLRRFRRRAQDGAAHPPLLLGNGHPVAGDEVPAQLLFVTATHSPVIPSAPENTPSSSEGSISSWETTTSGNPSSASSGSRSAQSLVVPSLHSASSRIPGVDTLDAGPDNQARSDPSVRRSLSPVPFGFAGQQLQDDNPFTDSHEEHHPPAPEAEDSQVTTQGSTQLIPE